MIIKKQAEMMKDALKKNDIIICTALIPGKPAPRILTENLVKLMKPGSIYDLAAEQGEILPFQKLEKLILLMGLKLLVKSLMNSLRLRLELYAKIYLASYVICTVKRRKTLILI